MTETIKKKYSTTTAIAKRRAWLRKRVFTYTERRDMYRESIVKLNKKIKTWNREIIRVDRRKIEYNKIVKLKKAVEQYMGVKLSDSRVASSVFYKHGLENGMCATAMMKAKGGVKDRHQAKTWAETFTETLKTNPENKEAFYGFQNWLSLNSK